MALVAHPEAVGVQALLVSFTQALECTAVHQAEQMR